MSFSRIPSGLSDQKHGKSPRKFLQERLGDRKQTINAIVFLLVWAAYLAVTLFLFHRQSVNYDDKYISDMIPYINHMAGRETGYDFPYPILFWTGRFFLLLTSQFHAMAFALTLLNGLTVPVLKYFMDRILQVKQTGSLIRGLAGTFLTIAMMFVSMLYPLSYLGKTGEPLEYLRYKGVFTPNPYHNATYLAARPFLVLSFFLLADLLSKYEKENIWKRDHLWEGIAFSVTLLLSTMTKPSYTLVAVSMAGVIMLFRLLRSKMRGWKAFWQLGVFFLPTFADLLYQFQGVFMGGSEEVEKGIGFGFLKAWSTATEQVPLALILGLAFPLVVLLFHGKALIRNGWYRLSWQILLMSVVQMLFLYEKGYRLSHLNFAWGYMCGMFLLYFTSLLVLVQDTADGQHKRWLLWCQWGIFLLHLICGVDYFRVLLTGGLFL